MARSLPANRGGDDLIVAPATAPGQAAIAIIRLSGRGAHEAVSGSLFRGSIANAPPGRMILGTLLHPSTGIAVDECLAVCWRAPRSYTGEDVAEFHLHGSPAVVDAALDACLAAGARLAEPGEFTLRAYVNGRMDLAQAEAVARLTQARTEEGRRAALAQLRGGLSDRVYARRVALVQATAELEAALDYPEEDLPAADAGRLLSVIGAAADAIGELLATARRGRMLHEGARVVLAGRPNAGKSSLFNTLLGRERAIVTPHPGTTRDTLEASIDLAGVPVTLVDTAGLRTDPEEIEAIGIGRSREELQAAAIALFLVDGSEPDGEAAAEYAGLHGLRHFLVYTKADLPAAPERIVPHPESCAGVLHVSVTSRQALDALEEALLRELEAMPGEGGSPASVATARQERELRRAADALHSAAACLRESGPPELAAADLTAALAALDALLGLQGLDEDVLDAVFSTFCLGK